jgi:hypothetical protein
MRQRGLSSCVREANWRQTGWTSEARSGDACRRHRSNAASDREKPPGQRPSEGQTVPCTLQGAIIGANWNVSTVA